MWGEKVDASNIFTRLLPRLSAVAERFWHTKYDYAEGEVDRFSGAPYSNYKELVQAS